MHMNLHNNWSILQDVHDIGERLGLFRAGFNNKDMGYSVSEWEPLEELKHLQLLYAPTPYYGRALRYFNSAPWWYKNEFFVPADAGSMALLRFSNVDYYAKVFLNGELAGEHEGYMNAFTLDVSHLVRRGEKNLLVVKVSSPWDTEVYEDRIAERTFKVVRNMVKGTYEHCDGLFARDVNPVGIYGDVTLTLADACVLQEEPEIGYTLDTQSGVAQMDVHAKLEIEKADLYTAQLCIVDPETQQTVFASTETADADGNLRFVGKTEPLRLWNTWDKGEPHLYSALLTVHNAAGEKVVRHEQKVGFRSVELVRTKEETTFYLNGRRFYVRGASYFPDIYVSAMTEARYRRDLLAVKAAGFNLLRVHVHVEHARFYELCDELGLAVIQDSEYNWMHPLTEEFQQRLVDVFSTTMRQLKKHCSILCWVTLNEPGLEWGKYWEVLEGNPGRALYEATQRVDPSRPVIRGSYCRDDLLSGDSHNYLGSLDGGQYCDIYGTTEKLNTEFGFDAPGCAENLKREPSVYKRLEKVVPRIGELQTYQYKLLKYYAEHYRMQKYAPNGGYVQFLFNDTCPQSFYGVYDFWGAPKKGLDAMLESNMPVGVFLKHKTKPDDIRVVSDHPYALGECTLRWAFTDKQGETLLSGETQVDVAADCCVTAVSFDDVLPEGISGCTLCLEQAGAVLAQNHYEDLFDMPPHPAGHPGDVSHEWGMRVYEGD